MNVGIVCENRQWVDHGEPFRYVAQGLNRLGHVVHVVAKAPWPLFDTPPDAIFVWNGVKGLWGQITGEARKAGIRTFIMERGFFDRFRFTQIDRSGFNHTASWASSLRDISPRDVPLDGQARFVGAWGKNPEPMRWHRFATANLAGGGFQTCATGYALVLCQVPNDSQLWGSELHHPGPLVRAVRDAAPRGLEVRVRAHPLSGWSSGGTDLKSVPLAEAVAGAAFCVTINSNAGNEALAMGCPVLCLGPALYAMAGVARQTTLCDLPKAMEEMAAGPSGAGDTSLKSASGEIRRGEPVPPGDATVRNYLYHLACRQWSNASLRDGTPLRALFEGEL